MMFMKFPNPLYDMAEILFKAGEKTALIVNI